MAIVEALAAFVLLFLIWYWFVSQTKSPITNWPLLGALPGVLSNASHIHDYISHLLQQSKHTIELKGPWFSKLNFIVTSDPENVHYILSTKFSKFNKGLPFRERFDVLGDGLIAVESDYWKMQRRQVHSLFNHSNFLKLVESSMQEKLEMGLFRLLDHAAESGLEVDMQDFCQRFTFDLTCRFLLGVDLESLSMGLPVVPCAAALDDIEEAILNRHMKPQSLWKLQRWLQIGLEKKSTKAEQTVDRFIYHHLSLKRAAMKETRGETFDLMSNFLREEVAFKCNNNASTKAEDKFLRDLVMNLLPAGRDDPSTALSWFFWLVSNNPVVESKLREELKSTFEMKEGDPWRFPTFKEMNKLVYLHATLCETLRLYPPLPFNSRASTKPDILPSGHRVKEGTDIIISIYAMGRMKEIWGADCCEFRPERWISEKSGSIIDVPSYKFNAFSAGPRTCLGKDLAMMELKMVAAATIWSYDLKVVKGHMVVPANSIIVHMQHGLMVNVTKRCI